MYLSSVPYFIIDVVICFVSNLDGSKQVGKIIHSMKRFSSDRVQDETCC